MQDIFSTSSDDIVITVSGHYTKRGWAERALQRLQEQIEPRGVGLNLEKTSMVNTLRDEAFGLLGFDLRRVRKQSGDGYFNSDDSEEEKPARW
jgi:hypothetical protein